MRLSQRAHPPQKIMAGFRVLTKMRNALFTYRRKVMVGDEEVLNDNYIVPLNVTSFFWSVNAGGNRVLSVFLANNYSIVFAENTGNRFVEHMEDFLRFTLGWGLPAAAQNIPQHNTRGGEGKREKRNPQPADIVEDEVITEQPAAQWQDGATA